MNNVARQAFMVSEKKKVVICFALGKKLLFKFEFTETVPNFGQNFPSGCGGRLLSLKSQGGGGVSSRRFGADRPVL